MAHEELKKQYEEDCEFYGKKEAGKLWQFYNPNDTEGWQDCNGEPLFISSHEYHRKEPPCTPECFTGLDREKAVQYCGRKVGYSYDGLRWENGVLKLVDEAGTPFSIISTNTRSNFWVNYIKTIPETYVHPTITIEVNGKEYKLPRPEVDAPKRGTKYWFVNQFNEVRFRYWDSHTDSPEIDKRHLQALNIHLTEDRAQAWGSWWQNTVVAAVNK
jgi:hypothetical protein